MNTAPYVFIGTNAVVQCYVDELFLLAANGNFLDSSYHKLGKRSWVIDDGKPKPSLRLNLTWNDNDFVSLSYEQLINMFPEDIGIKQLKSMSSLINENTLADEAETSPLNVKECYVPGHCGEPDVYRDVNPARPVSGNQYAVTLPAQTEKDLYESSADGFTVPECEQRMANGFEG